MTLYMIGIGLCDEKDITVKGLDAVKSCSKVFLEIYTSKLQCPIEALEGFYGKKIIPADRSLVESSAEEILKPAKEGDVAFLVIGDVFSATTHVDIMQRAEELGVRVDVINNNSVLIAVGCTGLQLYKFGKTASIPFQESETPKKVFENNQKIGLHTLFLLDLDPINDKFLTIKNAIDKLGVDVNLKAIGCARLGCLDQMMKFGKLSELKEIEFGKPPYCLIIPGELHFIEEEYLEKMN